MINNLLANSKTGFLFGALLGACVLSWFLISPARGPILPSYSANNISFFILSTCVPVILGGAISGSLIEGVIVRKYIFANQLLMNYKTGCVIGSILGAVVFYPIGAFLGVVLGSMFGGSIGSTAGRKVGIGNLGIPIGIALGMLIVIIVVTLIGAVIGAFVGFVLNSIVRKISKLAI